MMAWILLRMTVQFNFQFKDEWDCLKKLLFSSDLILILMEMNEIHCDSSNIDFKTLFTHIENLDADEKKNQEIENILSNLNKEEYSNASVFSFL